MTRILPIGEMNITHQKTVQYSTTWASYKIILYNVVGSCLRRELTMK